MFISMVRRGVINSITSAFTKYYNNIIPCTQYYYYCHIIIIILIFEYFRVRFPRTGNTSDILGLTGFLMYKLWGRILYYSSSALYASCYYYLDVIYQYIL